MRMEVVDLLEHHMRMVVVDWLEHHMMLEAVDLLEEYKLYQTFLGVLEQNNLEKEIPENAKFN